MQMTWRTKPRRPASEARTPRTSCTSCTSCCAVRVARVCGGAALAGRPFHNDSVLRVVLRALRVVLRVVLRVLALPNDSFHLGNAFIVRPRAPRCDAMRHDAALYCRICGALRLAFFLHFSPLKNNETKLIVRW